MAVDRFLYDRGDQDDPASSAFAVTPHDSTDFAVIARALYVGGAGNVVVVLRNNTAITFTGVPQGAILPIMCRRVNSTNTTATNIVGLI